MQEELLIKLTNRHLAKLLDSLDEVNSPAIIKEAVKREFWYFSDDIKTQVLTISKEQEYGLDKD